MRRSSPRLTALLLVWVALAGCGKKSLSKGEARVVTAEIVAAARRATARSSAITIEPQPVSQSRSIDRVTATLDDDKELGSFRVALGDIAQRHDLVLAESGTLIHRFDFTFNGHPTHSVDVAVGEGHEASRPLKPHGTGPRLAIIIDDLGEDRREADAVLALHFPMTVSVLPNLPFSSEVAKRAHGRQDEVMLHLPMQSQGEDEPGRDTKPEPEELRVGMSADQVSRGVVKMLVTVPYAVGVNNHQGSRATSDPALMASLMKSLRGRNLYFIDSRTTADTIAYQTAEDFGVKAASRKVFLDDKLTRTAILKQLDQAVRDAQRDGYAIAIGHPHPETIAALSRKLPQLKKQGIQLVFPSELVR